MRQEVKSNFGCGFRRGVQLVLWALFCFVSFSPRNGLALDPCLVPRAALKRAAAALRRAEARLAAETRDLSVLQSRLAHEESKCEEGARKCEVRKQRNRSDGEAAKQKLEDLLKTLAERLVRAQASAATCAASANCSPERAQALLNQIASETKAIKRRQEVLLKNSQRREELITKSCLRLSAASDAKVARAETRVTSQGERAEKARSEKAARESEYLAAATELSQCEGTDPIERR